MAPTDDPPDPSGVTRYADPRSLWINEELSKYAVGIMPVVEEPDGVRTVDSLEQGSGTCIMIGGRYFVATAAHVVAKYPEQYYAIFSPFTANGALKIVGAGKRGGG